MKTHSHNHRPFHFAALALAGAVLFSFAASSVNAAEVGFSGATYTQDFQSMTASALTPATVSNTTMLEVSSQSGGGSVSGWYCYHQASGTPRWGRTDGTSTSGSFFAMYDAQSTPDRALGSQGASSIIAFFGVVLKNTSGSTIQSVNISFDAMINRNPSSTANAYPCSYLVSSTGVTTSSGTGAGTMNDSAGTWTSSSDLSFTTPSTGTGAPNSTQAAISPLFRIGGAAKSTTLSGLNWGNNQYLYIRWKETDESGSDATAGVDNFSISVPVSIPTLTTPTVTSINTTSATLGANVTANGGATLTSRGTVWGTTVAPTGNSLAEGGTATGTFTHSRTGLTANTAYVFRGYAVNSAGTGYSADGSFTTLPLPPTVGSGSSATTSGFTANWSHPTMGNAAYTYTVEVDDDSNFGSINATISSIASSSTSQAITGLAAGTTYYYRVRSVNAQGSSSNSSTSAGITTSAISGTLATSTGSLSALSATTYGSASDSANFTVTGSGLDSSGVTVTPPAGFEVSTTSDFSAVGTSVSPLSLGTSATLSTTVYVRLAATTVPGSYSGNISVAGGSASTQTVAIASSTVNTKALTITSPAVTAKTYDGNTSATITGNLNGIIGSDTVTLTGTGTFNDANAGSNKPVTSTSTLGGTHAARYTLTQPTGLTGTINKASQTITFGGLNPAVVGGSAITLSATANSSLPVSYSSSDAAVATVAGSTVTTVGAGTTTITASQAGDGNYNAATSVTQTLKVVPNVATTLAAGDLAVIGYQTTGSPDYFYILVLKDLGPGTTFFVNDNEIAANGGTSFTDLAEGEASFTVKAGQVVAAGTILNLPWGAAAVSTTQYDWSTTSGFGMGNNNEEIYIYTAAAITDSAPTAFVFGAAIGTSPSARPSGLTVGSTFISPANGAAARYKLTTATYSGTAATLLSAIGNTASNWEATAPAATTDWTFSVTPPPTISTSGTLSGLSTTYGTASTTTQFSVSGANMTAGILVTPPSGFEVSTDNSAFSGTVTVGSSGTISSTTVYVRLAATASAGSKSGNIALSSSGATGVNVATVASTVNAKELTVTGLSAAHKAYDGLTTASVTGTAAFSGLENGDSLSPQGTVTWAFANATVGTSKSLTRTGAYTVSSANYTVTQPTLSADISARALTITANNVNKVAGFALAGGPGSTAFTSSGLQNGETVGSVTISYGTGANISDGAGRYSGQVTPSSATGGTFTASNYSITYNSGDIIVSAAPTISPVGSLSALSTTYGTASTATSFTVSGGNLSDNLSVSAPAEFELSSDGSSYTTNGLTLTQSSGTVSSTTIYVRLAATTAAGSSYSGNVAISGGGASSQNVAIPTSTVAKKALTIIGLSASNRVYDASTAGTVSGSPQYSGFVNGQTNSVTDSITWTFATKNVGTAKPLAASGDFSAPSANYTVTQPSFSADITAATLTFTGGGATSRAYAPGNTNVTITGSLSGVIGADAVNFTGTGTIASANAGTGIAVTAAISLGGTDAGNYSLTQPTGLTVDITKASQTITFGALANKQVGDAPFALSATSNSGLTVSYTSSNTGVATVAGNTVTIVGVGSTTITASQAGDSNYNAATSVTQSLTVTPGPTTLAIGDIAILGFNANAPDGFAFVTWVDLGPNTVIKFTDNAFLSSNSATSASNGRGGENFVTWTNNTGSVIPAGTVITIIDGTPATTSQGSIAQSLNGLASGGDQIFAYQGAGAGTSTSNSDFGTNANPSTFTGTILFGLNYGGNWLASGTAGSGTSYRPSELAATYGSIALTTSTTTRGQYTGARTGLTLAQLKAAVVDPANWTTGTSTGVITLNTTAFTIAQPQTITFGSLGAKTYGDSTFALSATADSGLTVSYTSSDTSVATVAGSTVTILKAGSTVITASQAGNAQYAAATSVQQTLTVGAKSLMGSFTAANKTYDGTTAATVTGTSLTGKVGSDDVSLTGGTATFDTASAGSNKTVTLAGASLSGAAAANYSLGSVSTTTASITAAGLPVISWSNGVITNSNGVASFSYLYTGRSSNGLSTSYSNSVVPTAAGFYTAVATSTDGNYAGTSTNLYYIPGLVAAADTVLKTTNNSRIKIPTADLLANDRRIDADGSVQTNNLSITAASQGTGSAASVSGAFVLFTPANGSNADSFTYTLTDSVTGLTTTGSVTVNPGLLPAVVDLQIVGMGTATFNGTQTSVTMGFLGVPGQTYEILYKGELNDPDWISAGPVSTGTGPFTVTITRSGNYENDWNGSMFFQARINP